MAGTATFTPHSFYISDTDKINVYSWACTTESGSGTVSGTGTIYNVYGEVMGFEFIPDSTATPTTACDLTIVDSNGYDVLLATGADITTTAAVTTRKAIKLTSNLTNDGGPLYLYNETLEPLLINAGDEKEATVRLYIKNFGKK